MNQTKTRYVIKIGGDHYLDKALSDWVLAGDYYGNLANKLRRLTHNKPNSMTASFKTCSGAQNRIENLIHHVKYELTFKYKTQLLNAIRNAKIVKYNFNKNKSEINFVDHYRVKVHEHSISTASHCSCCGLVLTVAPYISIKVNSMGTANVCYPCLGRQKGNLEPLWNALPQERREAIVTELFLKKL